MNKVTTTLAGLAVVAAATVAPAFAQGNFFTNGPFVFQLLPANSFTVNAVPVTYSPFGAGAPTSGLLSLNSGSEVGTGPLYTGTQLTFVPTGIGPTITDTFAYTVLVNTVTNGYGIASLGTGTLTGDTFNMLNGNPVPEASTVISFGALLALGGLAVLRRKSAVKNAA